MSGRRGFPPTFAERRPGRRRALQTQPIVAAPRGFPRAFRAHAIRNMADPPHPVDQMAEFLLEQRRLDFEEYGNPSFALDAYRLARRCRLAVPEWILAYFDQCADAFGKLVLDPPGPKQTDSAIALAFRLKRPGRGRQSVFDEARQIERERRLFQAAEIEHNPSDGRAARLGEQTDVDAQVGIVAAIERTVVTDPPPVPDLSPDPKNKDGRVHHVGEDRKKQLYYAASRRVRRRIRLTPTK